MNVELNININTSWFLNPRCSRAGIYTARSGFFSSEPFLCLFIWEIHKQSREKESPAGKNCSGKISMSMGYRRWFPLYMSSAHPPPAHSSRMKGGFWWIKPVEKNNNSLGTTPFPLNVLPTILVPFFKPRTLFLERFWVRCAQECYRIDFVRGERGAENVERKEMHRLSCYAVGAWGANVRLLTLVLGCGL